MTSKFADLQLTLDDAVRMPILHPTTQKPLLDQNGVAAFIEVLSTESQAYRDRGRAETNARLTRTASDRPTAEEAEVEIGARFAVLVKDWHLVSPKTGLAMNIPCTPVEIAELFSQPSWLRQQVDIFVSDRANFA